MKEEILKLRSEGKSYGEIQKELRCSKSTISYYCGAEQKEKTKNRKRILHSNNKMLSRVSSFTNKLRKASSSFYKRNNLPANKFGYKDVLEKFGENTKCYLTGKEINLYTGDYQFDHIIPASKGGSNELDNLGVLCSRVNQCKNSLTVEEFIQVCKEVLEYNGFLVTKI